MRGVRVNKYIRTRRLSFLVNQLQKLAGIKLKIVKIKQYEKYLGLPSFVGRKKK